jgi:tetratricopeptide (TPR) repeat protein
MSQRAWDAQFLEEGDAPTHTESAWQTRSAGEEMDDGRPTVDRVDPLSDPPGGCAHVPSSDSRVLARLYDQDAPTEMGDLEEMFGPDHLTALRPGPLAPIYTAPTRRDVNATNDAIADESDVEHDAETLEPAEKTLVADDSIDVQIDIATPKPTRSTMRPKTVGKREEAPKEQETVWDAVEVRYRDEGHWSDLLEMYLQRVEGTRDLEVKSTLFKRIGEVLRDEMDDAQQALDAFVEALLLDPADGEALMAIETIARERNWWSELLASVKREMANVKDNDRQVALCEHAMRWAKDGLKSPARGELFLDRIRQIDPGHPAIHRRLGEMYREHGAWESEKESLERAMLRARDDEEKRALHLALGASKELHFNDLVGATAHYEAALAIEPRTMSALQGLERICRIGERFVELVQILEGQVEASSDDDDRIDALIRLADVHERHFVKPQHAAQKLEDALRIDPRHEGALIAAERCYHAMRAWIELVRVLEQQAKAEESTVAQIIILVRVAELYELKMDDSRNAAATWLRVYDMDPSSERALGELARLAERATEWSAAAAYRAKLADLATSPDASAKIHVAIGEMLSMAGRDPKLARVHYEKAASIHPGTTEAWEALEKEARRNGDSRRVMMFLEKRAASCDVPRMKGQLFVELAALHKGEKDVAAAELAYERAIKADPKNEVAAEAVLATFTRERRWADAQPLCELLVNVMPREGASPERQFTLLRLATRIASELGQKERALAAATNAYRVRPTLETAHDAIDAAYAVREEPALLARAGGEIEAIVALAMEFAPAYIAKLGRVKRALGHDDAALALYSKALTQDAELTDAMAGLAEILVARGDWERACAFKQKLAHAVSAPDEQFGLLVEAGEMWAHRAKNLPMAALAFEEALAIKPRDSWLLHTLLWLYGELECWEKLIETLRVVAEVHEEPAAKAKSIYAIAMVVRDHMGDLRRTAALLEEVLDLDPSRLDAFERVVRVHTEVRDWMELKHAYGRMLRRLKTDGDVELKHALFFQLGLIYRDRLGDAARALDAFRAAQRLKPDAPDVRKGMTELFIVTEQLDEGVNMVRAALKKQPQEIALYNELYDLFLRKRSFDRAWCAVDALVTLGATLDNEKSRFYGDYPPPSLSKIPGTLTASAWRSHILHAELDPALTAIFALVTPAVMRARIALVPFQALRASLGEPLRSNGALAHEVLRSVADASEILNFQAPSLHVRKGTTPLAPAPAKSAMFVSLEACEALPTDALAFVVGKRLAETRPELMARAACPSVSEMKAMVMLAVQLAEPSLAMPSTGNPAFDKAIAQSITREEKAGLRAAIAAAKAQGSELDVARWSQLAEISTARVGLLLSGRIEASKRGMHGDPRLPGDLSPKDKLSELLVFSVSEEYGELRGAIGVAVEANAAA